MNDYIEGLLNFSILIVVFMTYTQPSYYINSHV